MIEAAKLYVLVGMALWAMVLLVSPRDVWLPIQGRKMLLPVVYGVLLFVLSWPIALARAAATVYRDRRG